MKVICLSKYKYKHILKQEKLIKGKDIIIYIQCSSFHEPLADNFTK